MLSIIAALAQSVFSGVEDRVEETLARSKRAALLGGIAGLMLLTAYILAVIGLCVALARRYGATPALFGLAGAAVLMALVLIGILVYLNKRDARRHRKHRRQMQARRQLAALAAGTAARQPLATATLGLALALLLGRRSGRRRHK
jgi:hypothetical protein